MKKIPTPPAKTTPKKVNKSQEREKLASGKNFETKKKEVDGGNENREKKLVGSYVEEKKINKEPIVVKKVSRKKAAKPPPAAPESSKGTVVGNEIEPQLFNQRTQLHQQIKQTDHVPAPKIN